MPLLLSLAFSTRHTPHATRHTYWANPERKLRAGGGSAPTNTKRTTRRNRTHCTKQPWISQPDTRNPKKRKIRKTTERASTQEKTIGVCSSERGRCLTSLRNDGPMLPITYRHPAAHAPHHIQAPGVHRRRRQAYRHADDEEDIQTRHNNTKKTYIQTPCMQRKRKADAKKKKKTKPPRSRLRATHRAKARA